MVVGLAEIVTNGGKTVEYALAKKGKAASGIKIIIKI